MKMSKTIQVMVNKSPDKFKEYHVDPDGHWIYCANDWFVPSAECQTCHGETVGHALSEMKSIRRGTCVDGYWR